MRSIPTGELPMKRLMTILLVATLAGRTHALQFLDLDGQTNRQVVVDRQAGQYLGHPTTVLLEDGRTIIAVYPRGHGKGPITMKRSTDAGLTWAKPTVILSRADVHLCEPGIIRSPDGQQLAVLLRENSRRKNSHVIFSQDEGRTWSEPREFPAALTGDRHVGKCAPDGRLFIAFRDTAKDSPTKGDWVAWVGTFEDIVNNRDGQYRMRLKDNTDSWDCAYPGVEILPDGTIVATTYGHWTKGRPPSILSVRLTLGELDQAANQ
jgi:hypothetical protein